MGLQVRSPASQIKTLQMSHTAATTAHVPVLINTHLLIPTSTAGANALNGFVYDAEVNAMAKATALAIAVGDKLYWDDTNTVVNKTASGNTACGFALEPCGSADTVTGLVAFNAFAA
jgi:predicted RecA/RadA family phage recombinase